MDLYVLDGALRRSIVVDTFQSLVWTERFSSFGDFELQIKSTPETRSIFQNDTWISIRQSKRAMIVETVENGLKDDGSRILTVKGRSLEKLLEDRVAKESLDNLTDSPKWVLTGTPGAILRSVFNSICVDGILDIADIIPFLVTGNPFPEDTIAEFSDDITVEIEPKSLYEFISSVCETYEFGFRLAIDTDLHELYFNIYAGVDRTSLQSEVTPILFSPELDNLQNSTEFKNSQSEKNVAYVFSKYGTNVVFADGVDPLVQGFSRKVLMVNASDITADTVDVPSALIKSGKEALANAKRQTIFDGEVSNASGLVYGIDYNLGDVVELRNADGEVAYKRVTEFIFSSDSEGDRAYPSLSKGWDTNAETWSAIEDTIVWSGYDTEVWDDFG